MPTQGTLNLGANSIFPEAEDLPPTSFDTMPAPPFAHMTVFFLGGAPSMSAGIYHRVSWSLTFIKRSPW